MKTFPTLYKKTSTGAIQQWTIMVLDQRGSNTAAVIRTEHGQVDGKLQTTSDLITEGKNIGKANETTPKEQAIAEAQAKYEKQLKKGYVTSKEAAQNEEVDELIEGGINPMLAHPFSKHGHKIKYPAFVSPKLDGLRIIAVVKNGVCTLWSRTRKPVESLPHLVQEIERMFPDQDLILDGEAFRDSLKKDFEKLVSLVRQEGADKDHELVEYHVFDIVNKDQFKDRYKWLVENIKDSKYLKLVENQLVNNEDEVTDAFVKFINQGQEGAMLRNVNGLYANKRSADLQKVKEFDDSEFPIVGVEEGRGKLAGHAIFVCKTEDGTTFQVKMKGVTEKLKEYFEDHSLWKNKSLTVQYQGKTAYNVPRFPVGIAVRDYE